MKDCLGGLVVCWVVAIAGCATPQTSRPKPTPPTAVKHQASKIPTESSPADEPAGRIKLVIGEQDGKGDEKPPLNPPLPPVAAEKADDAPADEARRRLITERDNPPDALFLPEVIQSVHYSYPMIDAALQELPIAGGKVLAAWGAFDLKLKAASENRPQGFYETYRQSAGFVQPFFHGGEVFGGYRIGRGDFPPWYLERQTNDGGEFKAGVNVPLARNRRIDERRADLWRATYDQQIAQPDIRNQLIGFVRDASIIYWTWVAAGRQYEIGKAALELSEERNEAFERRVKEGDLDPPTLLDNERSIASRQAKLLELERKLDQSAVKLSLFFRNAEGQPLIPDRNQLPNFPDPTPVDPESLRPAIQIALGARPELEELTLLRDRTEVDAAEAANDLLPNIDAQLIGSQDVGHPTSKKRDKSRFELEVGVFVDVPLQRRKGFGKLQSARAKQAQITAKRRFTEDKIVSEVQAAFVALDAAYNRVGETRDAREGAEDLADIERRKFELGQSDLLAVFLREQIAIEAAIDEVNALFDYYLARADYAAALAYQWVDENAEPVPHDGPLCPPDFPAPAPTPNPVPAPGTIPAPAPATED